jgi:hypothetical protein
MPLPGPPGKTHTQLYTNTPHTGYGQLVVMVCWLLWSAGCYGLLVVMVCWLLWSAGCYGQLLVMVSWSLWSALGQFSARRLADFLKVLSLVKRVTCHYIKVFTPLGFSQVLLLQFRITFGLNCCFLSMIYTKYSVKVGEIIYTIFFDGK